MKTFKTFSKIGVIGLTAMTMLVACGKKDDGGGAAANPCNGQLNGTLTTGQVCINGQPMGGGAGNLLNNVQFQTSGGLQGVLSVNATAGAMNLADPNLPYFYSGLVTFSGNMSISNSNSYCGAMFAGAPITGTAMYGAGGFLSSVIIMAGTVRMEGSGLLFNNSGYTGLMRDAAGNRLGLNVQMLVNNSINCGSLLTY